MSSTARSSSAWRRSDPRRRRGDRLGHDQRPRRFCLLQGFHRLRRFALRDACRQDHQGPGHGPADAGADHRPVRRRRRAHPGGRRGARRLWRGVPPQRRGLGRDPADFGHHGALRGGRRLFARHDRLHRHGAGHELHVRHRPGRGEDGHQRDRHGRGTRRRPGPYDQDRRSPTWPSTTTSRRCCRSAGSSISCRPTTRPGRPTGRASTMSSAPSRASTRWCRRTPTSPTTSRKRS